MKSLKKLYITLSISMAVMIVIIASVGNAYIHEQHNKFLAHNAELSQVIKVLQQIDNNIQMSNVALEDLFLLPSEKTYLDAFFSANSQANVTISALIDLEWQTTNSIRHNLTKLLRLVNKAEEIILFEFSGKFEGNIDSLNRKLNPIMLEMLQEINDIENFVHDLSKQEVKLLTNSKNNLIKSILVVAFLGIIITLCIYSITSYFVLTPLKNLTFAINKEALGEETNNLKLPKYTEMKQLIKAFINMRQQVKLRQAQLEHQALHDGLTGLPNRSLLIDRINQFIKVSQRNNIKPAVILMDLDRFKEINDTLGHHVGDTLLQEISRRLLKVLRNLDTIARLGGDEFAILLHDVNIDGAIAVTNKITKALSLPIQIENHQLLIRCSQGIAIYPEHGETDADLLKHADIAMYIAKRGQLGHCVYDPKKNKHDVSHISLSADLTNAIKWNELELYFQPKLDSSSGELISAEALLRWNHPSKGFISPEFIVEVAEQSGLIQQLTEWVIQTAIKQVREWEYNGIDISVSVNLSVFNLRNPNLVERIHNFLNNSQLDPQKLILEVTESLMMLDPELAADMLTRLSNMGLQISIDDFGTGYSSLAYLKNLPVQELKIDRSFVMNLATDKSDISIVKSTIELAHNLGLSVVAEGVENQESWDILNNLGCDLIQGYFISKPLSASDFFIWHDNYSDQLLLGNQTQNMVAVNSVNNR